MKVYCPTNKPDEAIGGGWTFRRNFMKALKNKVHFVDSIDECEILFVSGPTMVDPWMASEARVKGKKIVFRVDNVPRKSRNKRSTPHERMKDFAKLADVVVYQSKWAKEYCFPLCGDGMIIYNGVDTDIFKQDPAVTPDASRENRYLYAYHGKSELKQFWLAHYMFQMEARKNPRAMFWFINDFGKDQAELMASNYDFWNGENHLHLPLATSPQEMSHLMQQCKYLIYPSVCDASPNVVLEARACGMEVIGAAPAELSGTAELLDPNLDITLERMGDEYHGLFQLLLSEPKYV